MFIFEIFRIKGENGRTFIAHAFTIELRRISVSSAIFFEELNSEGFLAFIAKKLLLGRPAALSITVLTDYWSISIAHPI